MKENYVPNDVFKFRLKLKPYIDIQNITVFTKPFPKPWNDNYDISKDLSLEEKEKLIQNKYFTKEKIIELKQILIDNINSMDNPFDIYCTDVDGNYNVTQEQLFEF